MNKQDILNYITTSINYVYTNQLYVWSNWHTFKKENIKIMYELQKEVDFIIEIEKLNFRIKRKL